MPAIHIQESAPWWAPHAATLIGACIQVPAALLRRRTILALGAVPVLLSAAWQRDAVTAAGQILILLFLWRNMALPPARGRKRA